MHKSRLSLLSKISIKQKTIIIAITFIVFFLSALFHSLLLTKQTFNLLQNKDLTQAKQKSQQAVIFPKLLSNFTLNKSDTLLSWNLALEITPQLIDLIEKAEFVSKNLFDHEQPEANLMAIEKDLLEINNKALKLQTHLHSSFILKNLSIIKKIDQTLKINEQALTILNVINQEPHSFIILLQNSEEIRASGGFMGSYARVDINKGKITNITIQDIYEPDGQFTGFVEAPPGAKQYLSGGEGLRLPDSNWHPDFPTASKTISSYFAFGDEKKVDSIIALNVDQVEKILKIVGDIYLPDYGLTVTADNLTALARADRNAFFAGSKQKANFLTALFNNLKIELTQLNLDQQKEIANTLLRGLEHKDLQLFSWHPQLQEIFTKYNIAGELEYRDQSDFYLYLPETNVGINKANKKITREVKINLGQNRTDLEVSFHNDNSLSNLNYINYQRIILDPLITVKEIKFGDEKIFFSENLITNSEGSDFKQVGFLIPLESGQSKTLKIILTHQNVCEKKTCKLQIQKQSGLQPTPYRIEYMGEIKDIVLEKDEVIEF